MRPIACSLVVLAAFVAGCPIYSFRPTQRTVTPVGPTSGTPTTVGTGAARLVQVHVINNTGQVVCYLHVSPASDTQWGDNRLAGQTLPHGAALRAQLDARYPTWDVLAQNCDRQTLAELRDQTLPADGNIYLQAPVATPPPPPPIEVPPQPVQVRLVNDSGLEIWYLMVSEAGAPWGDDRLGSDQTIPPGEEVILELDANLMWDYMAEDRNHASITEQYNVRVFEGAVWSIRNTHGAGTGGGGGDVVPGSSAVVSSGNSRGNLRFGVVAAAYLGASSSDARDLVRGDCGFIDNSDLADFCRGDCSFIDNSDVADLCRRDCGFIDDSDLADFCRGDCSFIDDSDLADLCRGDCSFIDDSDLADLCRAL
ncbi:MAG: hypothetical protein JXB32_17995 [Deltaproteobacteria bacterium]|nr:hypothetical protein [Deltaproteobacteria bacterium]